MPSFAPCRIVPMFAAVVAAWAAPRPVAAHSRWQFPGARSAADGLTEGPCGGVSPTDAPTELAAGATVELSWVASQSHGNSFRIAFSAGDDLGFDDGVLGTLPDLGGELEITQEVALPACTCDRCSLQLLQLSTSGNAGYYSCADIRLVSTDSLRPCEGATSETSGSDGASTSETSADDAGSTGADVTDGEGPRPPDDESSGSIGTSGSSGASSFAEVPADEASGCACSSGSSRSPSVPWWMVSTILCGARRRRARAVTSHRS